MVNEEVKLNTSADKGISVLLRRIENKLCIVQIREIDKLKSAKFATNFKVIFLTYRYFNYSSYINATANNCPY